jgi:hypothetical protein
MGTTRFETCFCAFKCKQCIKQCFGERHSQAERRMLLRSQLMKTFDTVVANSAIQTLVNTNKKKLIMTFYLLSNPKCTLYLEFVKVIIVFVFHYDMISNNAHRTSIHPLLLIGMRR